VDKEEKNNNRIKKLEQRISDLKFELEEVKIQLEEVQDQKQFYQLVADFAFGWELWLEPEGKIKYCSPSCNDLTGYSANQVVASGNISELLVYEPDRKKFNDFISQSLDQTLLNQSLEVRILTLHKQLRWCSVNVRGVYNKQGRYLGIRVSIQDITKLKRAMGHISDLSAEKERESRARLRIKSQLDTKERELTSFLLQLSKKNEIISQITHQLKKATTGNVSSNTQKLIQLLESIENTPQQPLNWETVEVEVEKLHPEFLKRLQIKHPNLTPKEKKLCVYLRLGLSSKEISGLQSVTSKSVEIARVRLRKKFKLTRSIRLTQYVNQI